MEGTWAVRLPVLLTLAVLGGPLIAAGAGLGSSGTVTKAIAAYATITILALVRTPVARLGRPSEQAALRD
jgi:hypothetical protein